MGYRFSKLPTGWTRPEGLLAFAAGPMTGTSIAALKCLLAISLLMDFHSRKATVSYSDFEDLTGLSRPMVSKGVKLLKTLGLAEVATGYKHEYELTERGDAFWAKIPYDLLRAVLKDIGNRGAVPLAALKIYVLLASFRPNEEDWIAMTYDQIEKHTKIRREDIRPALSVLYSTRLLHAELIEPRDGGKAFNAYFLRGLTVSNPRHAAKPQQSAVA